MTCWICSICCSSFSAARVIRLKCDLAEVFGWSVIWLKCVSSLASLAASFNCSRRVPHHHHHLHWLLPVPFEATLTSTCAVWGHIIIYLCRSRPHWLLPVPFEATLPSTCAVWGHIIIYLCRLRPHWLLLVDTAWYILYDSMESHFRTIRNELARWTPKLMSGVDAFHSFAPEPWALTRAGPLQHHTLHCLPQCLQFSGAPRRPFPSWHHKMRPVNILQSM